MFYRCFIRYHLCYSISDRERIHLSYWKLCRMCCKKKGTKVWKIMFIQLLNKNGLRKEDSLGHWNQETEYPKYLFFLSFLRQIGTNNIQSKCAVTLYGSFLARVCIYTIRSSNTSSMQNVTRCITNTVELHPGCSFLPQMIYKICL